MATTYAAPTTVTTAPASTFSAPVTGAHKYDMDTGEKSMFISSLATSIFSTLLLLVGVILFWVGIGLYYAYRSIFITALTTIPIVDRIYYPSDRVGGIYIIAAILATISLVFTLLPILSGRKWGSKAMAALPAGNLLFNIITLTWLFITLIVLAAYYALANHATSLNGGCNNLSDRFIATLGEPRYSPWCVGFGAAHRVLISATIFSLIPLALTMCLLFSQLGNFGSKHTTATTYVERRTDVSVA